MDKLTERQYRILKFIEDYVCSHGHAPTLREIGKYFSISLGGVQRHVKTLIRKGHIKYRKSISRGIDLISRKPLAAVPLLGRVHAGIPAEPAENIEDYVYVDKNIVKTGEYFALKVKGDSMTGSGIMDGDIAVIRQQDTADDHDIVVAMAGEEAAVKKLRKTGKDIYLESTNPKYKPIHSNQITVLGKIVYLLRKY